VRHEGDTFFVQNSDEFLVALVRSGIPFADLTVRGATLEEAFLTLTEELTEPQEVL
jgi:ABC-2 type transport system ATP-binding protein